jgi:CRISPR-associated protein Csx17
MDKEKVRSDRFPIEAVLPIHPKDMTSFLYEETDDRKIEELLWGFMLIDWREKGVDELRSRWRRPVESGPLPRSWSLLKLLFTSDMVGGKRIKPEPRITALLQASRIGEACRVARRRLRTADLAPLEVEYEEELNPRRLLAGLLVPVRPNGFLERMVLTPKQY